MDTENKNNKKFTLFKEKTLLGVNISVFLFGIVSLFTDLSSEMVGSVLPLYLLSIGANAVIIGLISGVSEATGNIFKGISGGISDKIRNRKTLVFTGYAISNISKPLIGVFPNWRAILALKFSDRIGKGIRTSPRDAIIAECSIEKKKTGTAFGLHRALDTLGAILGPIVAFLLILIFSNWTSNIMIIYQFIIVFSIIPGIIAIIFVLLAKDEKRDKNQVKNANTINSKDKLTKNFILFIITLALIEFASIDFAFFIVRAQDFLSQTFIPLIVAISNILYVVFALLGGKISDKIGCKTIILLGLGVLLVCSIILSFKYPNGTYKSILITFVFGLFGIYIGLVDPTRRSMVSDIAGKSKKGKAYGLYYLVVGLITLPETLLVGFFYNYFSFQFAFIFSSIVLVLCMIIFGIKKFNYN